jgi:aspartyl-tRNA(Asn)/glutamyl-tRNA(Gln) amidotransferase subunit B
MAWEIVIGIETHAHLLTKSKIFSGASTAFGAAPNTQASAVDIALPACCPAQQGCGRNGNPVRPVVGGPEVISRRWCLRENYLS